MFMCYLGGGIDHAESERLRTAKPPQLDTSSSEVHSDAADL